MKVSYQWVKEYTKVPSDRKQLIDKIGSQLGAIEDVDDLSERYKRIYIVKVVSVKKHPNSDHLKICEVDDGGQVKNVHRLSNKLVQVVCGAPNVRADMRAVWIPPGSVVPSSVKKEPFILEAREIRGEVSNGMLASPMELGIGDNHDGLLEITEPIRPGKLFSDVYYLDDVVIDIENKMFTHRPDCFGILGVAREIAGIQNIAFTSPKWYLAPEKPNLSKGLSIKAINKIPKLVPRFMVAVMEGVKVQPSPIHFQTYLSRVGVRPINNIVDVTNYIMLLTGQPLHAYDYDKLKALDPKQKEPSLIVRLPEKNEKIKLLNGQEFTPSKDTMMIAGSSRAIGVAGVMGGAETEVDEGTTNIVLECATFDMYSIRRASMSLGLFTDAVTRFNKGQSPFQNDRVLYKTIELINEISKRKSAVSCLVDDNNLRAKAQPSVTVPRKLIDDVLGVALNVEAIKTLLKNVEFDVSSDASNIKVTPPFWRTDVTIPEDVVEEVGRLYGLEKLPVKLPKREILPVKRDGLLDLKSDIRNFLASKGASEVLSYSFVSASLIEKADQSAKEAFEINNARSPDSQYYRLSILPSLLEKVHPNIKAGFDHFALFEINPIHIKGHLDKSTKLPTEDYRFAMVVAADNQYAGQNYKGAAFYEVRKYVDNLLSHFEIKFVLEPIGDYQATDARLKTCLMPFESTRTVLVKTISGEFLGVVGELTISVRSEFKLPKFVAGAELSVEQILKYKTTKPDYEVLPRFPFVEQDICLKVPNNCDYQSITGLMVEVIDDKLGSNVSYKLEPVDMYQSDKDLSHKQVTLRLKIASFDKTMTAEEVNDLLDQVAAKAKLKFKAVRI